MSKRLYGELINTPAFVKFIDKCMSEGTHIHSFRFLKDGRPAVFADFAPYSGSEPMHVYSLSKAFTSIACGIACDEGLLSLDEKMCDIFPDKMPEVISERLAKLMRNLMKNNEFRNQFLNRYSEVYDTILSNKKVLERLDYYEQHLAKEAERDWSHWGIRPGKWNEQIDRIRKMIVTKDWQNYCVDSFFRYSKLSDGIRTAYFG